MRVPKYYTCKVSILDLIRDAVPGAPVPTERDLAERFDTSRTTVRQALAELVAEGRLERVQGSGTFVAEPRIVHVRQLTSFSEDLGGRETASDVLALSDVAADGTLASHLGIAAGAPAVRLERVRRVGGRPLAHETAHLPGPLPGLADELERRGSLYAALRDAYDTRVAGVEDDVETALAAPDEARILEVEVGLPLLVVHRTAWDERGRVVEWTRSVFRGDRFRFRARSGTTPHEPSVPAAG